MNKQTITSICSLAALSAAMISPAYAAITATPTSLDVNFNDAADYADNTTFKRIGNFAHSPTGGIAADGALDFPESNTAINWNQSLTGGVGTTITQSLVFTDNNIANTNGQGVVFHMGFTNDVNGHVTTPTAQGGATADALQLQLHHNPSNGRISMALRPHIDGAVPAAIGTQKYSNFAYTGTNTLQFDLTLTRTGANTFDWGYVLTDLDGIAGAGPTVMGSDTQSLTFADFGTSMDGGGIYAGLRSGNQTAGLVSDLDSWSVTVVPEPSVYALLAGALALGSVMIRRRRS